MKKYSIAVLSTDSFSDCWEPFFTLFSKYWSSCDAPLHLITETKTYSHPGLNIRLSQTKGRSLYAWPTWSESLIICLEDIETDYVLIMLDDFFMSGPVLNSVIDMCVDKMENEGIPNITLTEHGRKRESVQTPTSLFLEVEPKARYRITTSPALWRKDVLRSYLRRHENAWQFEIFGTRRSWRRKDRFLIVNGEVLENHHEGVIPYFHTKSYNTGIVMGRWQESIVNLFKTNGIEIDYSLRGFFKPLPGILNKYHLFRKIFTGPVEFTKGMLGL
jgi:hypothetical protein